MTCCQRYLKVIYFVVLNSVACAEGQIGCFLQTGLFATAISDCIITVTELEKILTLEKRDLNYSLSQVVPSWITVLNRKRSLAIRRIHVFLLSSVSDLGSF